MNYLLKVNEQGGLNVPAELLSQVPASEQYLLEIQGKTIVLRPANTVPLWQKTKPVERVIQWQNWASQHQVNAQPLPEEALHRDNIYEE